MSLLNINSLKCLFRSHTHTHTHTHTHSQSSCWVSGRRLEGCSYDAIMGCCGRNSLTCFTRGGSPCLQLCLHRTTAALPCLAQRVFASDCVFSAGVCAPAYLECVSAREFTCELLLVLCFRPCVVRSLHFAVLV